MCKMRHVVIERHNINRRAEVHFAPVLAAVGALEKALSARSGIDYVGIRGINCQSTM